ncbi:MAG TPA: RlmE family RNA methyltransferase [Caulobacteraceae bacterium]|jgi:23S rRNA (uridine2552-2'-O)-methyltransferase
MSDEGPRRLVRPPMRGQEGGRGAPARLKTAKKHTPSSQAWLERQVNDPYAAEARAKGYRSRAAFKLIEIDDRFRLLRKGARVVDLGCAPGGWVQVALERGAGAVAGIDLLPVEPIAGAELLEMDFTEPDAEPRLIAALGGAPDLILSDMAPNTIGHRQTDHLRIMGLIEAAAEFAITQLKPGGAFVTKTFQGGESAEVMARLKRAFAQVKHAKPKSSRVDSSEVYWVATGLRQSR